MPVAFVHLCIIASLASGSVVDKLLMKTASGVRWLGRQCLVFTNCGSACQECAVTGKRSHVECAQVNQEKLRYVNPAAREAMNATRTAFGADYEAKLRMEAGAAPDKLSRRKHQISSLYNTAKMKVRLEHLVCALLYSSG